MDMDSSMTCVRMLIGRMNAEVEGLRRCVDESGNGEGKLNLGSKIKVVFGGKGTSEEWQRLIERQVSALTLLLAACHCNTISDQKILLEKPNSRKVFKRVKDDTVSMYVHRDTASIYSRCTDTLSKISIVFSFDRDLFITKVYERALRGSLKASLRRQQADFESSKMPALSPLEKREMKEQKRRSEAIDRRLEEDSKTFRREANVLLMGADYDGQELLMEHMRTITEGEYTTDELRMYKPLVWRALIAAVSAVTERVQEKQPEQLGKEDMNHIGILAQELEKFQPEEDQIPQPAVSAMARLWKSQSFSEYLTGHLSNETYLHDSMTYFFSEIERIGSPNYIPTRADALRIQPSRSGVQEIRFTMGQLAIRLSRVVHQQPRTWKWFRHFESVTSIIFMVDLCCYNEVFLEDATTTRMMVALVLFDSVVNSQWFMRTSIILFLTNASRFKQKLDKDPLGNYFPDYTGGNDVNRAAKYLLWRFHQVNRAHVNLYPHLVEVADTTNVRLAFAAVKETILQETNSRLLGEL